jgi:hypothetical protein
MIVGQEVARLRPDSAFLINTHHPPASDYVEAALEASCATLIALQLVRAFAADDPHGTRQTSRAITAIRQAIDELRAMRAAGSGALVHGFVVGGPSACSGDLGPPISEA